jgi:hypothetical protein
MAVNRTIPDEYMTVIIEDLLGGMTRSTEPHVYTYMCCPYFISTLYQLLEESQM